MEAYCCGSDLDGIRCFLLYQIASCFFCIQARSNSTDYSLHQERGFTVQRDRIAGNCNERRWRTRAAGNVGGRVTRDVVPMIKSRQLSESQPACCSVR